MIEQYFHRWEQQLADVSKHERLVRPFEWGEDWIDSTLAPGAAVDKADARGEQPSGLAAVSSFVDRVMRDTDAFYTPEPVRYTFTPALPSVRAGGEEGLLTFPSGFMTPHDRNNTVLARYFPAAPIRKPRPGAPRRPGDQRRTHRRHRRRLGLAGAAPHRRERPGGGAGLHRLPHPRRPRPARFAADAAQGQPGGHDRRYR